MKTIPTVFLLLSCLLLLSCERETLFQESDNGYNLKEVLIGGEIYCQYTYNNSGLVIEEKSRFHYSKYSYNSSNQLIQSDHYWDERIASSSSYVLEEAMKRTEWVSPENTERDSYQTFQYNTNGQLVKEVTHREKPGTESVELCSYNSLNQIYKRSFIQDNRESGYKLYFYDYMGNMNKQQHYYILENGIHQLQTTTEYEFDNKHNPYYSFRCLLIPGQNTNVNNIVKETYTLHFEVDKFIQPVQIKEYSFEYNEMDYPVKRSDGWEFIYN